jgi:hypothetical protein
MYHAIAMHAYTEAGKLKGPLGWYWLHGAPVDRYWPALPEQYQIIPLLITEWGDASLHSDYQPESTNPLDCPEVIRSLEWLQDNYYGESVPDMVFHWNAGGWNWYEPVVGCGNQIVAFLRLIA